MSSDGLVVEGNKQAVLESSPPRPLPLQWLFMSSFESWSWTPRSWQNRAPERNLFCQEHCGQWNPKQHFWLGKVTLGHRAFKKETPIYPITPCRHGSVHAFMPTPRARGGRPAATSGGLAAQSRSRHGGKAATLRDPIPESWGRWPRWPRW
jgi:hypothetical protein